VKRYRGPLFGAIAVLLVIGYGIVGSRVAPVLLPGGTPTPTPTKPIQPVDAPRVSGTIAFTLRGDVYLLSQGRYVALTKDGRSSQPHLAADGKMILFTRSQAIDGKRDVDGQVTPAILRYSDIVKEDPLGGPESIAVSGLRSKSPAGFHVVAWLQQPALAPDGKRFALTSDGGDGASDLEIFDINTGRRVQLLSQGADLADPGWSPDGKTIVVTSYTLGDPRILLVPADGKAALELKIKSDGQPYRPSFSPDGKWIVYTLRHEGRNDVHVVELAGGRDVALTSDGRSWNAVFSPEGSSIAFLREAAGVIDLYAMELADALSGGAPKPAVKLTRGEGIDGESRPSWGR